MENLLIIAIVVIGCAVVLQAITMVALFLSVKKSSEKTTAILSDLHKRTAPILESAQAILADTQPKITTITDNLVETSNTLREQSTRLGITVNDALDRTRLQVIRADELVTRTMDRVEETTDMVHMTVLSPVKQLSAIMTGLMSGVGTFFGARKRQPEHTPEDEEMFI